MAGTRASITLHTRAGDQGIAHHITSHHITSHHMYRGIAHHMCQSCHQIRMVLAMGTVGDSCDDTIHHMNSRIDMKVLAMGTVGDSCDDTIHHMNSRIDMKVLAMGTVGDSCDDTIHHMNSRIDMKVLAIGTVGDSCCLLRQVHQTVPNRQRAHGKSSSLGAGYIDPRRGQMLGALANWSDSLHLRTISPHCSYLK